MSCGPGCMKAPKPISKPAQSWRKSSHWNSCRKVSRSFRDWLFTQKGTPRKALAGKTLANERPDLVAYLDDLQQRFGQAEDRLRAARAAQLAEAALTLIAAMRREYAAAKARRAVLDYDDLIVKTLALLERGNAAQWVLYKLDNGIDHILIDEAQDTSPEQWAIVRKLTEEFFAGTGRDRALARTIFAVGDEKQSIFSFQGADPTQFDINRHYFERLAEQAEQPFVDQPLVTSRRSAPEILQFVDHVFFDAAARAGLTSRDQAITHLAHRAEAKGGIEFWTALAPPPAVTVDPYLPVDAQQRDSPVIVLAQRIAGQIRNWLDSGATLPGHERPIAPGDIMILLPRREPFGGEIIRQLKLRRIPVAGADRIALTEQIAIMDLMALGRFVLQRGGRPQSGVLAALAAMRCQRGRSFRPLRMGAPARSGNRCPIEGTRPASNRPMSFCPGCWRAPIMRRHSNSIAMP